MILGAEVVAIWLIVSLVVGIVAGTIIDRMGRR